MTFLALHVLMIYFSLVFQRGTLLFYGMTISERGKRDARDEQLLNSKTKRVYAEEERERRVRERAVENSRRPLDVIKRKTGTSG